MEETSLINQKADLTGFNLLHSTLEALSDKNFEALAKTLAELFCFVGNQISKQRSDVNNVVKEYANELLVTKKNFQKLGDNASFLAHQLEELKDRIVLIPEVCKSNNIKDLTTYVDSVNALLLQIRNTAEGAVKEMSSSMKKIDDIQKKGALLKEQIKDKESYFQWKRVVYAIVAAVTSTSKLISFFPESVSVVVAASPYAVSVVTVSTLIYVVSGLLQRLVTDSCTGDMNK